MSQVVLGAFNKLELYSFGKDAKFSLVRRLSDVSCLFHQVKTDDHVCYVFYSAMKQLTLVRRDKDGNEQEKLIGLPEVPCNAYISTYGGFLQVVYLKSFDVLDLATDAYLLQGVPTLNNRMFGRFSTDEHFYVYQDGLDVKLLDLQTKTTTTVHSMRNVRQAALGFAEHRVVVAAPYFSSEDAGYVKVFDGETQIMNQSYQKADAFTLQFSAFEAWFLAIAKCEVDENDYKYYYYGTRQLHFFDVRARKVLNFSTSGQQVHATGIQVLNRDLKQELLMYVVERIPTQLKMAIVQTQTNICTMKQLALGQKTTVNSISCGNGNLILRGEGGMDGVCYSCKVNSYGQSFNSAIKIIGKKKILYKTHVQFTNGLILMGTLVPRLNVDNGVWVFDAYLNEVAVLPYEKLMRMEVLGSFDEQSNALTLGDTVEGAVFYFDIPDSKPASGAYVPPRMRYYAQKQQAQASKTQSVSLFD